MGVQPKHISAITINRATPADAETIVAIRSQAWLSIYPRSSLGITKADILRHIEGEHGQRLAATIAHWRNRITEEDGVHSVTFVARLSNQVVGFVGPRHHDGKQRIGTLYVSESVRGQGIGTQLLQRAIAWFNQLEDIYLYVVSYNDRAIAFYERYGFKKTEAGIFIDPFVKKRSGIDLPKIEMVLSAKIKD